MSDYTKLPRDLRACLQRAGTPLSEDQYMLITGYLAQYQHHTNDNQINSLKLDLIQSAAEMQEMARCLNECLDQVNEAITVTMRSGNRGVLKVNGKKLTPGQVAERLEYLSQQRDRILKVLHPMKTTQKPNPDTTVR